MSTKENSNTLELVTCYECEKTCNREYAHLVPFSLLDLMELNDELESKDLLEGSDEIGDFYICNECWTKLGEFVTDTLKDLRRQGLNGY